MRSTARRTHALRSRAVVVTVAGAAAALLGAGAASAATISTAAQTTSAATTPRDAEQLTGSRPVSARDLAGQTAARTVSPAAALTSAGKPDAKAPALKPAASKAPALKSAALKSAAPKAAAPKAGGAQASGVGRGSAKPAAPKAASQVKPVGMAGPQAWMPIGKAQLSNATTIVRQALAKNMGMQSAVIAVATSMQESQLQNIGYGTSDSLGLFQQQPDCGWGTAQQVMNPAYSADAFLGALQHYQSTNPGWVHQPMWQAAQGVQHSAFPFAYAKWETQAAHLVSQVMTNVK